jgi:nucleoside phosphorylase
MSSRVKRRLNHGAYTVALICPLEVEMSAARYMLDEEHERLRKDKHDTNSYILGRLSGHNVVIASLPEGSQGTVSAATVAGHLDRTFPAIELRLLVGIGGGVPSEENDIRLGDVVVSTPLGTSGGVIQYDLGKQTPTGFEVKGFLSPPPTKWRSVMTSMKSDHRTKSNRIREFLSEMLEKFPQLAEYQRPPPEKDVLFRPDYEHDRKEATCANCDKSRAINRRQRAAPDEPVMFYGLIASGNRVMKHAIERDIISKSSGGAICFEMEAAGLMNDFRCIVIRGISDYSDSHKNDEWHAYAAAVAAGLAKEILSYMDPIDGTLAL